MIDYLATFIVFFAVVDPIGTVPVFIAVTSHFENAAKNKIALISTLVAAAVLLFFVVAGELILIAMSIPLSGFKLRGGIVLFLYAVTMIFGESKPDEEMKLAQNPNQNQNQNQNQTAVFPLAVPSIASPGAMLTAVVLTENNRFSILEQAQTAAM